MTDPNAGLVVLPSDIALEVAVPVVSRRGHRSPGSLNAVGTYLAPQPRYVKRDVDGKPGDETLCNFLVREGLRMLDVEIPRLIANGFAGHFRQVSSIGDGWTLEPRWVARELAERGVPVVGVQEAPGHGHVTLLQASRSDAEYRQVLEQDSAWMCQAGASNFAHGLLLNGFRKDLPIWFFSHP